MRKAILLAGASLAAIAYCLRMRDWEDWHAEARRAVSLRHWRDHSEGMTLTSVALTRPPVSPWWRDVTPTI
jgi:hypothetical protein